MLAFSWLFLFNCFLIVISDFQHIQEMGFKFWLVPGVEECYHELLEKGSRLYFMYEILNPDTPDDYIVVYIRNANNGSIVAQSRAPQRGHLDLETNETTLIDICMDHDYSNTHVKYLSVFFHVYHVEKILAQLRDAEQFDNSSMNAQNTMNLITHNIVISREHQMELEMINQKDLYLIEKTFSWINQWAYIHILIIFSCFLFQTYFIKRLFKTSRK